MIETYKVLSGSYDTSVAPEIPIISEHATRGNSLKIANRRCHYNLRKYSFSMRITNVSVHAALWCLMTVESK